MSTGTLLLPVLAGTAPGGGSNDAAARPEAFSSSSAASSGNPGGLPIVRGVRLLFSPSTDQHWLWQFAIPQDYASGGTLRLWFGVKTASNNVVWKAALRGYTDSTTDISSTGFDTSAQTTSAAPGTNTVKQDTIALSVGSLAAGRFVVLEVGRDADNTSDNNTGDAVLYAVQFEYTV